MANDSTRDVDRRPVERNFALKLRDAIALKDHAIENNLEVPDETIILLNNIDIDQAELSVSEVNTHIDKALKSLTKITYPTTAETLRISSPNADISSVAQVILFKILLFILPGIALGIAIFSYIELGKTEADRQLWESSLALSLGLMGTLVYIIFNVIGELSSKAFNISDTFSNYLRMVLGALFGWVFYFLLLQGNIGSAAGDTATDGNISPLLLLPLLAGYSTRLVLGFLNQAVRAAELTFGIEDRGTELLSRRRRGQTTRDSD